MTSIAVCSFEFSTTLAPYDDCNAHRTRSNFVERSFELTILHNRLNKIVGSPTSDRFDEARERKAAEWCASQSCGANGGVSCTAVTV